MIYLSGAVCGERFNHPKLGFMLTPDMGNVAPKDVVLAADNGCFTNPANYSDERFFRFLESKMPKNRTLFAVAPDVFGSHEATVERSLPILAKIRELGFRSAFVAQDGWVESSTPWDELDALFVGGSTEFKFRNGREAVAIAKRHRKWVHMGRVNSLDRLRAAVGIGCDSADGTFLKFGPDVNWPRLRGWLDAITAQPEMSV